jgi:hypothetical protein
MSWVRTLIATAVVLMASCRDASAIRFLLFTSEGVLAYETQAACERRDRDGYSIVSRSVPKPGSAIIGGILHEETASCQRWRLRVAGHGQEDDGTKTEHVSSATRMEP